MTIYRTNGRQPSDPADHMTELAGHLDIAELIEITRSEDEALRQLNSCVAQLCRVQAAKEASLRLSPAELRAALMRHLPTGLLQQQGEPR